MKKLSQMGGVRASGSNSRYSGRHTILPMRAPEEPPIPSTDKKGLNSEVAQWAELTENDLTNSAAQFTKGKKKARNAHSRLSDRKAVKAEKKLKDSLSHKIRKKRGIAHSIGYNFERHGVFREKGVGRPRKSGSRDRQEALASATGRTPAPWFNPVLRKRIPDLADRAAKHFADLYTDNIFID